MANPRNNMVLDQLRELLAGDAKTFFIVDYQGLTAAELGDLRRKIKDAGGRLFVAKNTLIKHVLTEDGVEGMDENAFKGPTAIVLVGDDPVAPAKAITDYAKDNAKDLPMAKGGFLQGKAVDAAAVSNIAKLPSREQLLSEFIGVLNAPMQQLVGVLEASPQNLVSVLQNYSDKLKEES